MASTSKATPSPMPAGIRLLDRVRQAIRVRHYRQRTGQAYVDGIRRFLRSTASAAPERWAPPRATRSGRTGPSRDP